MKNLVVPGHPYNAPPTYHNMSSLSTPNSGVLTIWVSSCYGGVVARGVGRALLYCNGLITSNLFRVIPL